VLFLPEIQTQGLDITKNKIMKTINKYKSEETKKNAQFLVGKKLFSDTQVQWHYNIISILNTTKMPIGVSYLCDWEYEYRGKTRKGTSPIDFCDREIKMLVDKNYTIPKLKNGVRIFDIDKNFSIRRN
jgi:hypothetical protein